MRVGLEKKAESQRIDTFELWCWRRLFRVPRTGKRFNQSILKEISPEYSFEAEPPKLWPPDAKTDLLENTLMLGKTEAGGEGGHRGRHH